MQKNNKETTGRNDFIPPCCFFTGGFTDNDCAVFLYCKKLTYQRFEADFFADRYKINRHANPETATQPQVVKVSGYVVYKQRMRRYNINSNRVRTRNEK